MYINKTPLKIINQMQQINQNSKKCFAIDYSGSTSGDKFYHDNVKEILDKKYKEGDDLIIWDDKAKFIPFNEYMEIKKKRRLGRNIS